VFSERLTEKVEIIKVETVVKGQDDELTEESTKKHIKVTKRIKRESDELEHDVLKVEATTERKTKRRRKT
jgi:N-glycosylase/DNA lyase